MDYLIAYRRILSINRSYNRLVCEIYEYNTIISRYLDVTFCIEVLCISYQTYVIFIAKMDTFERYLVANIYFSNLLLLSVLIAACSSINSSNCKMGKISVELIQKLNDSNRFNRYQLDKVILENNIFFRSKLTWDILSSHTDSNNKPKTDFDKNWIQIEQQLSNHIGNVFSGL